MNGRQAGRILNLGRAKASGSPLEGDDALSLTSAPSMKRRTVFFKGDTSRKLISTNSPPQERSSRLRKMAMILQSL